MRRQAGGKASQSREGVCFWERAAVATGRGLALSSKAPDPGDGTGDAVEMKDVQQTVWPKDAASQMPALTCTAAPALSGEGDGSPLQCSCLENPRDGGAWWAAVYGVTQSWTRLKPFSSSSSQPLKKVWCITGRP